MAKERLQIELIADAKKAVKNLKQYTKEAKKSGDQVGKLTKLFKNHFAGIAAGILIARKVIKVVANLTDAYKEQELAVRRMESALRATGTYTPTLSKELQQIASDLQETSRFGDEATLQMAGLLQSLAKLNGEGLKQTIPLVHDFAEGMGIDLNTAASLIGKTLGSTTNALSRYGIILDMTGTQSEKLEELTRAVNDSFGGMAAAMGDTYAGQTAQLGNAFGDLKEEMGELLGEAMRPMIPIVKELVVSYTNYLNIINDARKAKLTLQKVEAGDIKLSQLRIEQLNQEVTARQLQIHVDALAIMQRRGSLKKTLAEKEQLIKSLQDEMKARSLNIKGLEIIAQEYQDLVPGITETITTKEEEKKIVIESSDAWTRWAESVKGATDAAIQGQKKEIKTLKDLTDETFKAFHASKTYNKETRSATIPAVRDLDAEIKQLHKDMEDQSALLDTVASPALEQFAMDLGAAAVGAGSAGEAVRDLAKNMISGLLIAIGKQLIAMAVLYLLALQFGKAAAALAGGIAAIAAGSAVANLQQGGTVKHLQTGGGFGDRVPAMLEAGEVVIPKEVVQSNAAGIGAMRGGEGGDGRPILLQIDGKTLFRWMYKESVNKNMTISSRAVI